MSLWPFPLVSHLLWYLTFILIRIVHTRLQSLPITVTTHQANTISRLISLLDCHSSGHPRQKATFHFYSYFFITILPPTHQVGHLILTVSSLTCLSFISLFLFPSPLWFNLHLLQSWLLFIAELIWPFTSSTISRVIWFSLKRKQKRSPDVSKMGAPQG